MKIARRGFTLIELLIVIGIIGILIALLLPSVQACRESARRHHCANTLRQLILAVQHYESVHEVFPAGTIDVAGPVHSRAAGYHFSWIARSLPFFEQPNVYRRLDFSVSVYDRKNALTRQIEIPTLGCASDASGWPGTFGRLNYAACHHDVEAPIDADNHGTFFLNSFLRRDDVKDGCGQTIFIGERLLVNDRIKAVQGDLGWASGTRATLRNTGTPLNASTVPGGPLAGMAPLADGGVTDLAGPPVTPGRPLSADEFTKRFDDEEMEKLTPIEEHQPLGTSVVGVPPSLVVGGFESSHPHGSQFAFGDGSVRFTSTSINADVYRRMGHRADGELLNERQLPP